jgi:hypothetical protein
VKVIFALVFSFFPFAAMAGSHTVLAIPPYELEDWFEGSAEQSAISLQITNVDEIIEQEAVGATDPTDDEDVTGRNNAAQESSNTMETVILKQETRSALIIPAQPALNWLGEIIDEAAEDASAGADELDEVPVGAIHPNNEGRSASKDRKVLQDTIEPSTIRAQMLSAQPDNVTAPREDANVSVAAPGVESEILDVLGLE